MKTALKSVNTHLGSNSYTGYFSIDDINVAFVISISDSLIIEPLHEDDTALYEFFASQPKDFSIRSHITKLFVEWCDIDFNERLKRDSQKGIIVGSLKDEQYRLYPIPNMLLLSTVDLQRILNQTRPLLSEGEEILNIETLNFLTGGS